MSNGRRWPWAVGVIVIVIVIASGHASDVLTIGADLMALMAAVLAYRVQQRTAAETEPLTLQYRPPGIA
ncbi:MULTISPECIES: hypothetical protein [unclassified Streptomyces]|uniref:hypothetical protein n=1 Tax=unclassified Streptomyces TaxID=2593676 RepID=UPI00225187CD|nr:MULTISPECIES: hypothetical protein [unclassified Streptomyces]MCX4628912.1 hypothetical protein [Streptomyces sp. NBC_01443]WSW44917.1 hypothetical protein OG296_18220 [Streptomyces sp. NBC_01001]